MYSQCISLHMHACERQGVREYGHPKSYKAIHLTSLLFIQIALTYLLFDASPYFI